jgi:hypothetical protein
VALYSGHTAKHKVKEAQGIIIYLAAATRPEIVALCCTAVVVFIALGYGQFRNIEQVATDF